MAHNAIYKNGIHHGVVKRGRKLTSRLFFVREAEDIFPSSKVVAR